MTMRTEFPPVGSRAFFRKTVSEADVGLFAGITGDFAPQHTDEVYMQDHPLGRRVAHGVLTLGLTSTAAARLCAEQGVTAVSYGYDRVRFLAPVFLGDTVTVEFVVENVEREKRTVHAAMTATRQDGEICLVGTHLLYCYPPDEPAAERQGGADAR